MEEWRDIPGYEGLYQICIDTQEGRCRSLNYKGMGIVKELSHRHKKKDNRLYWTLYKGGKKITQQAARWIALTFPELIVNEYFESACIDHINAKPTDNRPSNLRWVTYKENANNPITLRHMSDGQTGRKHSQETKEKISNAQRKRHLGKDVAQIAMNNEIIKIYPSSRQAQRETGISQTYISLCCNGKKDCTTILNETTGIIEKYTWRYI